MEYDYDVDIFFEDEKDNVYPDGEYAGQICLPIDKEITFLMIKYSDGTIQRFQKVD